MIGTAAEEALPYVYLLVAFCTLTGFAYAGVKWARNQLKAATTEDVAPLFVEVNDRLGHLHDCLEKEGADAARRATEARVAAESAEGAATAARTAVDAERQVMQDHIAADSVEFGIAAEWRGTVDEWRGEVDVALRNIQQGQAPHVPEEGTR